MILVDTSVVVDVLSGDPDWSEGSARALELCAAREELSVNDIVFAELAAGYPAIEPLEAALDSLKLTFARLPKEALFLAGHAFRRYRRAGGTSSSCWLTFLWRACSRSWRGGFDTRFRANSLVLSLGAHSPTGRRLTFP